MRTIANYGWRYPPSVLLPTSLVHFLAGLPIPDSYHGLIVLAIKPQRSWVLIQGRRQVLRAALLCSSSSIVLQRMHIHVFNHDVILMEDIAHNKNGRNRACAPATTSPAVNAHDTRCGRYVPQYDIQRFCKRLDFIGMSPDGTTSCAAMAKMV